jgi:gliding motility-associated-like protein
MASSGTYNVTVTVNGCSSGVGSVSVMVNPTPVTPIVSNNGPVCTGNSINLTTPFIPGATYNWTGPNNFNSTNQNPTISNITTASTGTYNLTVSLNGCKSNTASTSVSTIPTPLVDAGPDKEIYEGDSTILTPVVSGQNLQFQWSPGLYFISADTVKNPLVFGVTNITYTLTVTVAGQCKSKPDQVNVRVLPRLKPIYIPNVFSPNGDGVNDVWVIRELAKYPEAKVDVYTRYGRNVFSSSGYRIPWNGLWNSEPLPTGTYYYVITTKPKTNPISGWVAIVR